MKPDLPRLSWNCDTCSTYWDANYLNGWNDGYKYAAQNAEADARRVEQPKEHTYGK